MTVTHKLIQQRPSTSVDFFAQNDSTIIDKVEEYKSAGKVISYDFDGTISEDTLTKTMTITFNSEDDFDEYSNDDVLNVGTDARIKHCEDNSISWSVEQA